MDKSWVNLHRLSPEYEVGLDQFLDIAFEQSGVLGKILCPCTKCQNRHRKTRRVTRLHLIVNGMTSWYKMAEQWIHHNEEALNPISQAAPSSSVPTHDYDDNDVNVMHECLQDIMHQFEVNDAQESSPPVNVSGGPSFEAKRFFELVEDANTDLFPGCTTFKKLEFIVALYQIKALHGWSDTSFSALLKLIKRALPEGNTVPERRNAAVGCVLGNRDRRGRPLGYGLGVRSSVLFNSRGKINDRTLAAIRQELTEKFEEEYQERLTSIQAEIEQRITKNVEEQVTKRLEEHVTRRLSEEQAKRNAEIEEHIRQFSPEPNWLTKMIATGYSSQSQTQGTFERPTYMPQSNYVIPSYYPVLPSVHPSLPQHQGFEESYRSQVASQLQRYNAQDSGD